MDSHHHQQYRREGEIPSFSSTLLDAIYRSIDEGHGGEDELQVVYRETMKTEKHSNFGHVGVGNDVDMASLQRDCLVDKWMEKKVSEKVIVRSRNQRDSSLLLFNSSSSSSDSSCGGGFSSSEAESVPKPKPIRTSTNSGTTNSGKNCPQQQSDQKKQQKPKSEGGFVKTKSRALKIYGDLKKVKQPISPGGRLASFLNSLFTAGNTKKPNNISSSNGGRVANYEDASNMERKSKSTHASTCSSASSFSRSCLSKTPSSRGDLNSINNNNNNGSTKRSVRFYPVSVIVDEDCQPIGQKSVYGERFDFHAVKYGRNSVNGNDEFQTRSNEKNRRVEEAARNLLKNYQKKVECEMDLRNGDEIYEDDDEEDDAASYASSDLFELDHLSERYREELPVYETTRLDTNRAIANRLFM